MSKETMETLNQKVLVGLTDVRGTAWHFDPEFQGAEPNHYPRFIPVEDVTRRLFNWHAVEGQLQATSLTANGVLTSPETDFKAIMRDDTGFILGVPKKGWTAHQYDEWLLNQVATILDADLGIAAAAELSGGRVAFVEVTVPDTIITPSGVEFRPNLLCVTSMDGSYATTYKRTIKNAVCDNTMRAGLAESGATFKVKHTRYSNAKLADAREALEIVYSTAGAFADEVEQLTNQSITDGQLERVLDEIVPLVDKKGEALVKRSLTMATKKRDAVINLWENDKRVSPWKNTAWGVVQAFNTADHHVWQANGDRGERNMLRAISGGFDRLDAQVGEALEAVLA